ncbi:MAG: hypothetical protein ABI321_19545 [Polyangia bacterium]
MRIVSLGLALTVLAPLTARAEFAKPVPGSKPVGQAVMRPDKIFALQRAKQTLVKAQALLEQTAAQTGETRQTIGFGATSRTMPKLQFRNETAISMLLAGKTEHSLTHAGFQMEVSARNGEAESWVPVTIGRHGAIANRLFVGTESVFGKATKLRPDTLAAASRTDLDSKHPLDTATAWKARSQTRELLETKAHVYSRVPAQDVEPKAAAQP